MSKLWMNSVVILVILAFILHLKDGSRYLIQSAQGFYIEDRQLENGAIKAFHIFFDSEGHPLVQVPSDKLAGAIHVPDHLLI